MIDLSNIPEEELKKELKKRKIKQCNHHIVQWLGVPREGGGVYRLFCYTCGKDLGFETYGSVPIKPFEF